MNCNHSDTSPSLKSYLPCQNKRESLSRKENRAPSYWIVNLHCNQAPNFMKLHASQLTRRSSLISEIESKLGQTTKTTPIFFLLKKNNWNEVCLVLQQWSSSNQSASKIVDFAPLGWRLHHDRAKVPLSGNERVLR